MWSPHVFHAGPVGRFKGLVVKAGGGRKEQGQRMVQRVGAQEAGAQRAFRVLHRVRQHKAQLLRVEGQHRRQVGCAQRKVLQRCGRQCRASAPSEDRLLRAA
jgi:hypothetical protein